MNKLADNKSIHSIIDIDSCEGEIDREFIAKAFFLPKEVLTSGRWKIENIRVCTGAEWQTSRSYLEKSGAHIQYDPNSDAIIAAARFLGVSVRKHAISGEVFVVVKLWYGEGSHQLFSPKYKTQVHVGTVAAVVPRTTSTSEKS